MEVEARDARYQKGAEERKVLPKRLQQLLINFRLL